MRTAEAVPAATRGAGPICRNARTTEEVTVSPRARFAVAAFVAFAVVGLASGTPAAAGGRPFTTNLTGAAEVTAAGVPNQGDLDGTGSATLRVNPGLGEVCWTITVSGIAPVSAAHLHVAPSTTTGPVVVGLNPYTSGCTEVSRDLARAIIRNPAAYYVNVHNAQFPGGALRGQLSR